MTHKLTVVVTGATGKQGGGVARGLLERATKSVPSRVTQTQPKRGRSPRLERPS